MTHLYPHRSRTGHKNTKRGVCLIRWSWLWGRCRWTAPGATLDLCLQLLRQWGVTAPLCRQDLSGVRVILTHAGVSGPEKGPSSQVRGLRVLSFVGRRWSGGLAGWLALLLQHGVSEQANSWGWVLMSLILTIHSNKRPSRRAKHCWNCSIGLPDEAIHYPDESEPEVWVSKSSSIWRRMQMETGDVFPGDILKFMVRGETSLKCMFYFDQTEKD